MLDLSGVTDYLGEDAVLALAGLAVGALFGASAQRSRFCLRAAAVEFARGERGSKLAVWLIAFSSAVLATQLLVGLGLVRLGEVRPLTQSASLSGAIVGGLMFGAGMVLSRGCSSRLLVLSATGNLRALLAGLVFAVAAQASLRGFLSPVREAVANAWTVPPAELDLLASLGVGWIGGAILATIWLVVGVYTGMRSRLGVAGWVGGIGAGLAVAIAWGMTSALAASLFVPVKVEAVTFTGPSANTLMLFLSPPGSLLRFDVGLVPGVFLGSFLAALLARELKLECFGEGARMPRYLTGAALMGFGGMLAGGCAVGSVSNASVFAVTGWVTLVSIWGAAGATYCLVDHEPCDAVAPAPPSTTLA